MVSGYLTSTSFPLVDDWSSEPWVLGHHSLKNSRHRKGRGLEFEYVKPEKIQFFEKW